MKDLLLLFCLIFLTQNIFGQTVIYETNNPTGLQIPMVVKELPPPETVGTIYIHEKWLAGNVVFKTKQQINNYELKFDVEKNLLEIKTTEGVKICDKDKLHSFSWFDVATVDSVYFINCDQFKFYGEKLSGVFEILSNGNYQILRKYDIELIKPTYVTGFDVGNRNNKLVKKEEFYFSKRGMVYKLPNNRKKFLELFPEDNGNLADYLDKNKIKLNKKEDLLILSQYLNSLP